MAVRILIADDDPTIRRLLRRLLETHSEWQISEEAADGAEAIEKARRFAPDLAILDLVMPLLNGLQAARAISSQNPCPLMLLVTVQHLSQEHLEAARSAGFRGAVTKDRGQDIVKAVEAVLNNELYFHLEKYTGVG